MFERTIRFSLCSLLSATMLLPSVPLPLLAQTPAQPVVPAPNPTPTSANADAKFSQARELIKSADYDGAIKILKSAIEEHDIQKQTNLLQEAYLLMINAYVQLGIHQRGDPQGYEPSLLSFEKARELIEQCLKVKALRHTHPGKDSPQEMINMFAEVRAAKFGAFQVASLEPADAIVALDGEILKRQEDGKLGDVDLEIGRHNVEIRSVGYLSRSDAITITPGSTISRPYQLVRKRGPEWYATCAVAAAFTIKALAEKRRGITEPPLPGPPNPPSGAGR